MHSYLIIGDNVTALQEKLGATTLEFPLQKINDARELGKLVRLSFSKPTLIVCRNIHEATEEALNAFLKNLEEPQENIYFALTSPSLSLVLPTIVSRCQIIRNKKSETFEKPDFIEMNNMQKIDFVSKIKDRGEAIKLVKDLINYLHQEKDFKNMELLLKTHTRLNASGNVNLQLSNLAINYK